MHVAAGDLALALDDFRVGDNVTLTVQRGAGDAQVISFHSKRRRNTLQMTSVNGAQSTARHVGQ